MNSPDLLRHLGLDDTDLSRARAEMLPTVEHCLVAIRQAELRLEELGREYWSNHALTSDARHVPPSCGSGGS